VIFAVYGDWLAGEPVSPAIVAGTNLCFRPDDPSVCVWVDSDQPSVLASPSTPRPWTLTQRSGRGERRSMKRPLPWLWTAGRSG